MSGVRTVDELMLAIRSFQESRVLLTALELDVFNAVGEGSTAPETAGRIEAEPRATEMLLNALVTLGAMEKQQGIFSCTAESKALGPARAGLMHTVHLWETWSTLTACVKSGTTQRKSRRDKTPREWTEAFIGAMHARARPSAATMVRTIGAEGVRRLLDIGGGPATFSIAFAETNPALSAEVLDLASVVPIAERNIREAGLSARVTARIGDLRTDAFGEGFDLILASAICHMLSEAENQDLFRRCAKALAPGGRLAIREFILDPERTSPRNAVLFALNMLVGTQRGNAYTEAEYREWLSTAGFTTITRYRNGEDLIIATKL
jgi:SAM-dependent methyltransferase